MNYFNMGLDNNHKNEILISLWIAKNDDNLLVNTLNYKYQLHKNFI